jgi:hypothetical protein
LKKEKPYRHKFSYFVIEIILFIKLSTSVSFKAMSKQSSILNIYLEEVTEDPTNTTIMNWVKKLGLYQLEKAKEKADDWIIILDHSIQLGQDKLFVVLGIRESTIDFSRPLQYQDLTPLLITSKVKWTGEIIKIILLELESKLGKIKYAVGDYGSDIKKGLELSGILHMHDVTHRIGLIVEKLYGTDVLFADVTARMSEMRIKLAQTASAPIIPPAQRKKSRYLNIATISNWATRALRLAQNESLDKNDQPITDSILWLKEYEPLISEMGGINKVILSISKILKHKGFSKETIAKCNKEMDSLSSAKGELFKLKINEYFEAMQKLMPNTVSILCSSDIIESTFGKYKNYVSSNPMACMTDLCLCIAAFTSNLDKEEIKQALESVLIKDIKKWTTDNIGESLLKKRIRLLSAA